MKVHFSQISKNSSKCDGPLVEIGVVDGTLQLQVGLALDTNWSGRRDTTAPSGMGP